MSDIIIGLKTVDIKSSLAGINTPQRPFRKRVFTEDEWNFLNTRPTEELHQRIALGRQLIGLLYRPELMNMNPRQADELSSNLRYQIEAINIIITKREVMYNGTR